MSGFQQKVTRHAKSQTQKHTTHTHTPPLHFLNDPALEGKQMGSYASIPVLDVEINRDSYFINGSTRHGEIHGLEGAVIGGGGFWRRQVHPFLMAACSQACLAHSLSGHS